MCRQMVGKVAMDWSGWQMETPFFMHASQSYQHSPAGFCSWAFYRLHKPDKEQCIVPPTHQEPCQYFDDLPE